MLGPKASWIKGVRALSLLLLCSLATACATRTLAQDYPHLVLGKIDRHRASHADNARLGRAIRDAFLHGDHAGDRGDQDH